MATSFQAYVNRENMTNPVLKNSLSKATPAGQRGLSAKPFHETKNPQPTPRKALGDLGNIRQGTAKKFETPKTKPSRVRIFDDTPKTNQRKSTKAKKGTFSLFNANKAESKTGKKIDCENSYPEIEKMTPFTEPEYDLPTPQYITRLLQHSRIINPSSLITPSKFVRDGTKTLSSDYEYDTIQKPSFDDLMTDIIGCSDALKFCEIDTDLPSLDDIPLEMPLLS